jgi:YHS domain-containing protein
MAVLSSAAVFAQVATAQDPRVVLRGHDPVAYFTDGKPVKGDPKISYDWDEGRYYFASTRNRKMFSDDPERYAPQFNGYCTGSMAKGVRNEGHPEGWTIADGKLYVFGAPDSATALKHKEGAEKDAAAFARKVAVADKNWREKK